MVQPRHPRFTSVVNSLLSTDTSVEFQAELEALQSSSAGYEYLRGGGSQILAPAVCTLPVSAAACKLRVSIRYSGLCGHFRLPSPRCARVAMRQSLVGSRTMALEARMCCRVSQLDYALLYVAGTVGSAEFCSQGWLSILKKLIWTFCDLFNKCFYYRRTCFCKSLYYGSRRQDSRCDEEL
jgi:hypothetical protein